MNEHVNATLMLAASGATARVWRPMSRARATTVLAGLCAAVLSCSSGETPRGEREAAPPDTTPSAPAATSDAGPRGVLALGTSWLALAEWEGGLAIVEPCDAAVESLAIDVESAEPRLYHMYGQDADFFAVRSRQERDSLLRLEIASPWDSGSVQLVVRDRRTGVAEVVEEMRGSSGRRSGLFVSAGYAAGFRRIPRQAPRCEEP